MNKYVQPNVSIHIPSWIRRRSMAHWICTRSSLQSFVSNISILRTMSRRGESGPKVTLAVRRPHFFLLTTSKSQPRVSPTHQHTTSFIDTKASPTATGSTSLPLHLHLTTAQTTSAHAITQQTRRIDKTSHDKQIDTISSIC